MLLCASTLLEMFINERSQMLHTPAQVGDIASCRSGKGGEKHGLVCRGRRRLVASPSLNISGLCPSRARCAMLVQSRLAEALGIVVVHSDTQKTAVVNNITLFAYHMSVP